MKRRGAISILAIVGFLTLVLNAPTSWARVSCEGTQAVDYSKPFDQMPKVKPPPTSGILKFAPQSLRIYQSALSVIQVSGGGFGYALSARHMPPKGLHLDWVTRAWLEEVDGRGRSERVVSFRRWKLGIVHGIRQLDFSLSVGRAPGLYRYNLEFKRGGKTLGAYSQYVRVVRAHFNAELQMGMDSYQPGEIAQFQVINRGTDSLSFGEGLSVERFDGSVWVSESEFGNSSVRRRTVGVGPGQYGPCEDLEIPNDALSGRYRITKMVFPLFLHEKRKIGAIFEIGT